MHRSCEIGEIGEIGEFSEYCACGKRLAMAVFHKDKLIFWINICLRAFILKQNLDFNAHFILFFRDLPKGIGFVIDLVIG